VRAQAVDPPIRVTLIAARATRDGGTMRLLEKSRDFRATTDFYMLLNH